nr:hypothetical protein [Klebsiella michiganensis]
MALLGLSAGVAFYMRRRVLG